MVGPEQKRRLPRREFLRRAAMATTATAVATTAYGTVLRPASSADREAVPRLYTDGQLRGVTAIRDLLVAVGSRLQEPAVWTCRLGDRSWSLSATGRSFPPGTVLAAVGAVGARVLAVGAVRRVSRVQMLIDDATGARVDIPIVGSAPAIFSSVDGARWDSVFRPRPGNALGAFTGIATTHDDTRALAIGSTFREPGVGEGSGTLAVSSFDGRSWRNVSLPGVEPPRHGAFSLLARAGAETVLGIREAGGTRLHATSGGRWRSVPIPSAEATILAAGTLHGALLVTGIDDAGRPRAWEQATKGWRDVDDLPGIPPGGTVLDLEEVGGVLVAAGSVDGQAFVVRIGG
jgi:hypothetical protein